MNLREKLNQPAPKDPRWDLVLNTLKYIIPSVMVTALIYMICVSMWIKGTLSIESGIGLFVRYCLLYIVTAFILLNLYGGYTIISPPKPNIQTE